jgi:hypothetical protein
VREYSEATSAGEEQSGKSYWLLAFGIEGLTAAAAPVAVLVRGNSLLAAHRIFE